ncbi:transposase, partial [Pseudomonas syringae pv. actinidiae]
MNERAQSHRLRTGRISGAGQIYLVTAKTFQRNPVFSDWRMGRLLVDELRQIQEQQLADSLAWVVMPDHIHWLLQLNGQSLSRVVQRVKSKSAIAINRAKGCSGPFWQSGFHDISVRNEDSLVNYARYVAPGVR